MGAEFVGSETMLFPGSNMKILLPMTLLANALRNLLELLALCRYLETDRI